MSNIQRSLHEAKLAQLSRVQGQATARPKGTPAPYVIVNGDSSISINVFKLPSPTSVYAANRAAVAVADHAISLFFAQVEPSGELLSKLVVRYPVEFFLAHFWKNSREFHEKVAANMAALPSIDGTTRTDVDLVKAKGPNNMTAVMSSNFDVLVQHGSESTLDFFHMTPLAMYAFKETNDLSHIEVEPKVRVSMNSYELLHLLDAANDVIKAIEPNMKGRTP